MSLGALRRHGQEVVVAGRPKSPPAGRTEHPPGGIMTRSITPLRISRGGTPDTPPSIATGHSRSKFGLPAGATATDRLIERMLARGSVRLRGIHMHLGSQIRDLRVYAPAVRTAAHYLRAWAPPELCVGGGLAVAYTAREPAPSIIEFAETVRRACADTLPAVRLTCELGRWIVAPAAVTLYTVGTVKHSPDAATIAAVDAGMTANMPGAPYGPEHEGLAPGRPHRRTHDRQDLGRRHPRRGRRRLRGVHARGGRARLHERPRPPHAADAATPPRRRQHRVHHAHLLGRHGQHHRVRGAGPGTGGVLPARRAVPGGPGPHPAALPGVRQQRPDR